VAEGRALARARAPGLPRSRLSRLPGLDTLGIGDRLPAQALAMLAVTHALGAEAAREEALTALRWIHDRGAGHGDASAGG